MVADVKVPEPLFAVINPVMRFLLRSPLHFIWSKSLLLITFRGRISGREFTTPVRYVRKDGTIHCFTNTDTKWWKNLRQGADVTLRVEGQDRPYHATVLTGEPSRIKSHLVHYLHLYPQDAAYHDVRLNKDKSLVAADLERAAQHAVVVTALPV